MNLRIVSTVLAAALLGTAIEFLALWAWHAQLGRPGVILFDLHMQTRLHALAGAAPGGAAVTAAMLLLTQAGSIAVFCPALCVVLLILGLQGRRHTAWLLGAAMAGALLLNETLKLFFHRARPVVPWSIGDEHTYSFPSGHSFFSVVLYGTLTYIAWQQPATRARRVGLVLLAIVLPLAIGTSRIYLGMHFPTDVLAGFLAGLVWLATVITADRIVRKSATA